MSAKRTVAAASVLLLAGIAIGYLLGTLVNATDQAQDRETDQDAVAAAVDPSRDDQTDLAPVKRNALEDAFPEFKNFENQPSFAGQSVTTQLHQGDHYFAYLVHGSGIPIAQATCFRVDRSGRVFEVGVFPDPLDSYAGHRSVDPTSCRGIR